MVGGTINDEFVSPVPPARLWRAGFRDVRVLVPKLMPEVIVSIDILEGDGGVGTIKKFNFTEVIKDYRFVTDRVEVMDDEKHVLKYVVINEGGHLGTKINSMSCEFKIDPSSDGGCVTKLKIIYDSDEDGPTAEACAAETKEGVVGMVKVVFAYLQANPDAYV